MGHFACDVNFRVYVEDDGTWWDSEEKNIQYDPETRAVLAKSIITRSGGILAPSGAPVPYAQIRQARLDQLYTAPDGRIWDSPEMNTEHDMANLEPIPVVEEVVAPDVIISLAQRRTNKFNELNGISFPELRKMCSGEPPTTTKVQFIGILMEKEFGKEVAE